MLVPSASRRVAARVASILSIERDMSVARPAKSRAFVGLDSAVSERALLLFISPVSSSSCISLGLSPPVVWGLFGGGNILVSK